MISRPRSPPPPPSPLVYGKKGPFVVTKCYWPARVSGNKPPRATTIRNRVVPLNKVPPTFTFHGAPE